MDKIQELHSKLIKSYCSENLNLISAQLIELYREKEYKLLRILADSISEFVSFQDTKDAKLFSKLILLYHPDKGENIRKSLNLAKEHGNLEILESYSHIFIIQNFEFEDTDLIDDDIDYQPEYAWDYSSEGFGFEEDLNYDDNFENEARFYSEEKFDFTQEVGNYERNVYNAIKLRQYGVLNIEFPTYYLHDLDELELSDCQIKSLVGIEYCIHTRWLDLSDNEITDISNLQELLQLEELFLANNKIGYIDVLSNFVHLKSIDLSGNFIDDASPLFELDNLEYINLVGNKIPYSQIEKLHKAGRVVMF